MASWFEDRKGAIGEQKDRDSVRDRMREREKREKARKKDVCRRNERIELKG